MERALAYRKVCESVNYIWPNRDFVIVCERPTEINRDSRWRLHCATWKAIKYSDDWGIYAIQWQRIDDEQLYWKIVKDEMTPDEIFKIPNTEIRRIAYEMMDKIKMKQLEGYKILDEAKDQYGYDMKIIQFKINWIELKYYNCHCPSWSREYFLETHSNTCQEAKSMSFWSKDIIFDSEY